MGTIKSFFQRQKKSLFVGIVLISVFAGTGYGLYVGTSSSVGANIGNTEILFELIATRDIGALSARGTGENEFCGNVGGNLGIPDHCWVMQGSGSSITDDATLGNWDLSVLGSPRMDVNSYLPVRASDGTISYDEKAVFFDLGYDYRLVKTSQPATYGNLLSVTMLYNGQKYTASLLLVGHWQAGKGWNITHNTGGYFTLATNDGVSGAKNASVINDANGGVWHCITAVFDGRTTNAAKFFESGEEITMSTTNLYATGNWDQTTGTMFIGGLTGSAVMGGMARVRVDIGDAATLEDHKKLCGDLFQGPSGGEDRAKPLASDVTFSRTGGGMCYPIDSTPLSATKSICAPHDLLGVSNSNYGLSWPIERNRINRVIYNTYIKGFNCVNWTCSTATIAATVGPDGSKSGANMTMGGGYVESTAIGYSNSTALHGSMWVKCSTGTLNIAHQGGVGSWSIDCSVLNGNWGLMATDTTHPALTKTTGFESDASGNLKLRFSGADAAIWMPTFAEEAGYSCIPTDSAAVSTGDITWYVNNTGAKYYKGTIVENAIEQIDGTCLDLDPVTSIVLDGLNGSKCHGYLRSLKLR